MIASLYQSGSIALASFFTPNLSKLVGCVRFLFVIADTCTCTDSAERVPGIQSGHFGFDLVRRNYRKYSKSVSTFIFRWILRMCPDRREGSNST
jgi:hypothetical protein